MSEQIFYLIFIILFGAALGSFFNVCIYRIPNKKSIIFPSSFCPVCKNKIKPVHNIPIISFLVLRGKCAECSTKIHWHYFLVELLTPLLFVVLFFRFGSFTSLIFWKYCIFFSVGLIIIFIDLFHKLIPDVLSLPLLIVGLLFSIFRKNDIAFLNSLIGANVGFIIFLAIAYLFKLILKKDSLGGGDIKLIAAIGSMTGFYGIIFTIFISSAIALITMILIRHDHKNEFPFGPFLMIGAFIYVIFGNTLITSYLSLFGLF